MLYSETVVTLGKRLKSSVVLIRITIMLFSYFCLVPRVAPCSLSGPPPEPVYLPLCATIPPHPVHVSPTLMWGTDGFRRSADAGLEPSAAPASF